MLTREETGWSLNVFRVFSILNILPIQVDVKSGRIQRQSNPVKVFMWKILFGICIFHWAYIFGRLVQSTILEPEKYFRWDHFVFHFGFSSACTVFCFTGFRLFIKNPEENVMIFNHLFTKREDPIQKMIDQEKQLELQKESGNGNKGNKKSAQKSGIGYKSTSTCEPREEGQTQVIEKQSESESEACSHPRPLLTWPLQYSLNELLAKLLPVLTGFTGFFIVLILAIDPSRPQLLYSSLPPEYQNVYTFLILLAVETLGLATIMFIGSFAIVAQILFFGKCQLEFQRMSLHLRNLKEKFQDRSLGNGAREIKREIWILRQILEEMRELVVLIELFNCCFPFCILAWKLFCLAVSVVLYFFVIRHHEKFPVLAAFIGYCVVFATLIYTIMYKHAFSIPGQIDDLKNEFLVTAQKTAVASRSNLSANVNKNVRSEMKREIKRIRGVGIKVGSFHQMERESTPNFIDFVFSQVVDLLVTIPR